MIVVDWALIGATVVFAWAGWRRGFVAGVLSFVGFLGGGILGALLLPNLVGTMSTSSSIRAVLVIGGVIIAALLGQYLASLIGRRLKAALTWSPVRFVDSLAGTGLAIASLAVIAWLLASAIAWLPQVPFAQPVAQSTILQSLDKIVPDQARNAFGGLRSLVSRADGPHVLSVLGTLVPQSVPVPSASLLLSPLITPDQSSVVQVGASSQQCNLAASGTGFAIAPNLIMTNAHVVAGATSITVQPHGQMHLLQASVVLFRPRDDIAVLRVDNLGVSPLRWAVGPASVGTSAVIQGFPNGSWQQTPARVAGSVFAIGDDIYGQAGVRRHVYTLRAAVRPGDSGAPLLGGDGTVLGMVFAAGPNDTGFALTSQQLQSVGDGVRPGMAPVTTGACRSL